MNLHKINSQNQYNGNQLIKIKLIQPSKDRLSRVLGSKSAVRKDVLVRFQSRAHKSVESESGVRRPRSRSVTRSYFSHYFPIFPA